MSRTAPVPRAPLESLASLRGVETRYTDALGRRRRASAEALRRVLGAMGLRVSTARQVRAALEEQRAGRSARPIEPVVVAWEGRAVPVGLRLPERSAGAPVRCSLRLESGRVRRWSLRPAEASRGVRLPARLPLGYHQLEVRSGGASWNALVVSAPLRAFTPPGRAWGAFLPLHALRTGRGWGSGDFADLGVLAEWVGGLGGAVVATLPLLAAFLDEPFEPSPYVPASRLFWNELFVAPDLLPEMERCPEARALARSAAFREESESLNRAPWVDYRKSMALKRALLEPLARCFFESAPRDRRDDLRRFLERRPEAEDYARFRAAVERRGPWSRWPRRMRDGRLREGDFDPGRFRYHLYAQMAADGQLARLSRGRGSRAAGLALDLPLGVHPEGYDAWRHRDLFVEGVSTGAPPDPFFTRGQNWGFPPPHPERIRESGYAYFIACLRHHLARASLLRVDHVMSLHRLFWIPGGMGARDGVYVRYRAEELYAILALESRRHRVPVVGEDLGTVAPEVRPAMERHGLRGMHVLQFESPPFRPVPPNAQASLNTHDTPTFASFWSGADISERARLGLLGPAQARAEGLRRREVGEALVRFLRGQGRLREGPADPAAVLRACLAHLAASRAPLVLVNLEDLWLEPNPQNVPGTGFELPNWRRKAGPAFEEFSRMDSVLEALREMDNLRRRENSGS
ncbi:MAG: 4-alpha-glucanotransferase [Halobacteria archaeon]